MTQRPSSAELRATRQHLLEDSSLVGVALAEVLADTVRSTVALLATEIPSGWALGITGGAVRRELCPGSDVDLVLLHPKKASSDQIADVGNQIWYPLWDAGYSITPLSHSIDSAIELAENDLVVATSWLDVAPVAGEAALIDELVRRARSRWQRKAKSRLLSLAELIAERHSTAGEVAFLLEPDLKEGRGGLRDLHALRWAERSEHESTRNAAELPPEEVARAARTILAARVELHRATKRRGDRLLLQEQDAVASALGYASADALMEEVSSAARTIAWNSDRFWWRVRRDLDTKTVGRMSRPLRIAPGLAMQFGALVLAEDADTQDPSLALRAAAIAAHQSTVLGRSLLQRLAQEAPATPNPWPPEVLRALLSLLGAGANALPVIESLDRYNLLSRVLPEWSAVRSKPQRNAYHRFTVDWHLCHTAVEATRLVRHVARPDLLLLGAWLHDIGKGFPGDHTEVGEVLIEDIATRMGYPQADVDVLVRLCSHHLLLAETATRRDLSDPGTAAMVAEAVKDIDFLQLLRALTEADSLATGPSAWSDWKRRLLDELTARTAAQMVGHRPAEVVGFPTERHVRIMREAEAHQTICVDVSEADGVEICTVAAPDRSGLLAALAGSLSLNGVEVVSADAWTSDEGIAVDELRVARRVGGETNWRRVEQDLHAALAGSLDLESKLAEKAKTYQRSRKAQSAIPAATEVLVDHDVSENSTVFEVRAPDAIGLLWRIARVIGGFGLDIRHAKVATLGHEVVDVFYLRQPSEAGYTKVGAELAERLRLSLLDTLRSAD